MKNIIKAVVIVCISVGILYQYKLASTDIVPVSVNDMSQNNPIKKKLNSIGIPSNDKLVHAISFASEQNKISTDIIIALAYTESKFKIMAVSNKGYKGLMQIPHDVYYLDANILIGTRILREKLNTVGDDNMGKALCLYKGYPLDSPRGKEQVDKVFVVYNKLRSVM